MPHTSPIDRGRAKRRQAGFSLIELVVALFVLALVLVAMLSLFDLTNKVARVETHVSEAQQSLRVGHNEIVRMVRMAARGWVIGGSGTQWDAATMVAVTDNVGNAVYIDSSTDAALKVMPGTDIVRIRGIINGSIFQPDMPAGMFLEPSLTIATVGPSGTKQDAVLDELKAALDGGYGFRLMLVSRLGDIAVVDGEVESNDAGVAEVTYEVADPTGPNPAPAWMTTNPGRPIALAGVVEEYAFYIRENDGHPRLSMARFQPGSNSPHAGDPLNLRQDIADEIFDLQAALGIDEYIDLNANNIIEANERDGDKTIVDANSDADEWFGNHPGDEPAPVLGQRGDLYFIRLTTVGRTEGRDFQYVSPPIVAIENHVYNEPETPATGAEISDRNRRRRFLQTVVDLRNM